MINVNYDVNAEQDVKLEIAHVEAKDATEVVFSYHICTTLDDCWN